MQLVFSGSSVQQGNVARFVFTPEQPITWIPGQYIHYTLPHDNTDDRGDERWFTISSAPFEKDIWITTRITAERSSSFKQRLQDLTPGDTIETDEPEGDFTVEDLSKDYVFVAGGIGITPLRSILNQLHHDDKEFRVELLYANRDEASIAFRDELEAISNAHEGFNITYFTGANIDQAALEAAAAKCTDPIFYVSGPEPMVEAFKTTLEQMGVDDQHAKFDYFPGYEAA
jgi:ferredoxin-NADP reductase